MNRSIIVNQQRGFNTEVAGSLLYGLHAIVDTVLVYEYQAIVRRSV